MQFLEQLNMMSGAPRLPTKADFERELTLWGDECMSRMEPELASRVTGLFDRAQANLRSRELQFGWVHGDFGYGNCLADPQTATLTSVIDWETASAVGMMGIDLFNFLVQRERTKGAESLDGAVRVICERLHARKLAVEFPEAARVLAILVPDLKDQLSVFAITLCRWVRREYRYTLSRRLSSDEFESMLCACVEALDTVERG